MSVEKWWENPLNSVELALWKLWEKTEAVVQYFEWLFRTTQVVENLPPDKTQKLCTVFENTCSQNPQIAALFETWKNITV